MQTQLFYKLMIHTSIILIWFLPYGALKKLSLLTWWLNRSSLETSQKEHKSSIKTNSISRLQTICTVHREWTLKNYKKDDSANMFDHWAAFCKERKIKEDAYTWDSWAMLSCSSLAETSHKPSLSGFSRLFPIYT